MKTTIALALGLLLNFGGSAALADMDHKGHGSSGSAAKKMDHGSMDHGAMSHGDDMHAMHTQMQALHDHSKMMEGMSDCGQLRAETVDVAEALTRRDDLERMTVAVPTDSFRHNSTDFRSLPHQHGTDGFYVAAWQKNL